MIEIPVSCLSYLSSVAGGGLEMAPGARVRLLLDSVPGSQSQQAFRQGPGGDSVSFAGHGVSTPRLSSGHALWQKSEQQVTWGHQTSQGWYCAVPPTARPPDKRRPRACHCCRRIQPSKQSSRGTGFTTISRPFVPGTVLSTCSILFVFHLCDIPTRQYCLVLKTRKLRHRKITC